MKLSHSLWAISNQYWSLYLLTTVCTHIFFSIVIPRGIYLYMFLCVCTNSYLVHFLLILGLVLTKLPSQRLRSLKRRMYKLSATCQFKAKVHDWFRGTLGTNIVNSHGLGFNEYTKQRTFEHVIKLSGHIRFRENATKKLACFRQRFYALWLISIAGFLGFSNFPESRLA